MFEQYLEQLDPQLWIIDDRGHRSYPMEPLYTEGPCFLLKRTTLYSVLKRLGLEPVSFRIEGRMKSHMTEAQIAMVWHDINPRSPKPLLLDDPALALHTPPAPIARVGYSSALVAPPMPAEAVEEAVPENDPIAEAEQLIRTWELLSRMAHMRIPVSTDLLARLLGVSVDSVRRRVIRYDDDHYPDQLNIAGLACERVYDVPGQKVHWQIIPPYRPDPNRSPKPKVREVGE